MVIEEEIRVETEEVREDGMITDRAVLDRLNHAAMTHGDRVGMHYEDLAAAGSAWMVMNWRVQYLRRPGLGEQLRVRTWSRGYDRIQAYRDFEVVDESGNRVVLATSCWIAVNPVNGVVQRITPELMAPYQGEENRESFPGYTFPKYRKLEDEVLCSLRYPIGEEMIDLNRHVHNTDYMKFVETLFQTFRIPGGWNEFSIAYRKAIQPDAEVVIEYSVVEGTRRIVIRNSERTVVHAVITLL